MGYHRRILAIRAAIAVFLLVLPGQAKSQNEGSMPLYQIHGSGTSNPALLLWRVMDRMMARTKPKIAMSYRSIGSGNGGTEFAANSSAFGCGDVPINRDNFNATTNQGNPMMHVPYLVGSVSIFHNIPGIGEGLFLPPCTLAKIFRGNISKWNDSEIVDANPQLPDLVGLAKDILVVYRNNGSSSTYALTHYLDKSCPGEWTRFNQTVGVNAGWPAAAAGRWANVPNSQAMVEKIASNPYSLGYVESGQGVLAGLQEVELLNANSTRLTSSSAEIAPESFIRSRFPLNSLTSSDWLTVNPVYAASNVSTRQWPLTLGTYFYVRTNLTYLGYAGGLLKLFLKYMLSDDVAALMPEYGFTALPAEIRRNLSSLVESTITGLAGPNWTIETSTPQPNTGQQDFVFSPLRDSYLLTTVAALALDDKDTKSTLKLGDAYQVHGSGSFVSALMLRHAMQVLQSRARVPVSMTYRAVGSVEAQREFKDYENMYSSYNHFKVGDMPLASDTYASLTNSSAILATIGAVLQLPFAISALGIYHTKAFGRPSLALNCTLLARLFAGDLTAWNDTQLVAFNTITTSIADVRSTERLTVFAMAAESGATFALSGYLAKSCGDAWRLTTGPATKVSWPAAVNTTFGGADINTPQQMLAALSATPNAIGYLPATLGASSGLAEAQLEVVDNGQPRRLIAAQTDLSRVVTQARSANSIIFSNASADVAAVLQSSLYGLPNTWPMPMVQYLYMYRNLSGYGYSGPLLRAFVEFILPREADAESTALALSSGLTPMPLEVRAAMHAEVAAVTLKTLTVSWSSEAAGLADGDAGAALYTFSGNRETYDAYALGQLQGTVSAVEARLAAALPAVLRVACEADAFGYIRLLRADVQDMATSPIRILDEMGSSTDILNLLRTSLLATAADTTSTAASPTQLVVHPGPLPSAVWSSLSMIVPIVQIPASIRPVAVLYRGDPGLNLSLCTLARIISGERVSWNSSAMQSDNPGLSLPGGRIVLVNSATEDGDTRAVLAYIQRGAEAARCSEYRNLSAVSLTAQTVATDKLKALVDGGAYSFIAFMAASALVSDAAVGTGLQAAALPSSTSGTFVTPMQTPETAGNVKCAETASRCGYVAGKSYTDAAEAPLQGAPFDPSGDWSGFVLSPRPGADVYPVIRYDFLVVASDLSKYGDDGAALLGVLSYATSVALADRLQRALSPYFAGLGREARRVYAEYALQSVRAAPTAPIWQIANKSTEQVANPSTTIVLGRAPSLFDVALAGSLEGGLAAASRLDSGLTREEVTAIAQQEVAKAVDPWAEQEETDRDKLDLTYRIAVAALVLGIVLSVGALLLALYAVSVLRAAGNRFGGCLNPSSKYEQQLDVPISHVEMRAAP